MCAFTHMGLHDQINSGALPKTGFIIFSHFISYEPHFLNSFGSLKNQQYTSNGFADDHGQQQ